MEKHWLEIYPKESEVKSVRIDSYWSKVFEIKSNDGRFLFPQLAALIKSVLTLSHGNAGPEQGFSLNKAIIDAHGTRLEDILIALRRIKHRILQVGGLKHFEITQPLLESIKQSRSRYDEEMKSIAYNKPSKSNKENDVEKKRIT